MDAIINTRGRQRIINHLRLLTESDPFNARVFKLRKKYNIPGTGLEFTQKNRVDLKKRTILHVPVQIRSAKKNKREAIKTLRLINLDIRKIAQDFPVKDTYIHFLLKLYFFYGIFFGDEQYQNLIHPYRTTDLCEIYDLNEELGELSLLDADSDYELAPIYLDALRHRAKNFPILIGIHPETSQREVVDFIRKRWPYIHYFLSRRNTAKTSLRKTRTRKEAIRERNNFIYQNRNLPIKEICALWRIRGMGTLDQGEVGKILSLERKRRKQV